MNPASPDGDDDDVVGDIDGDGDDDHFADDGIVSRQSGSYLAYLANSKCSGMCSPTKHDDSHHSFSFGAIYSNCMECLMMTRSMQKLLPCRASSSVVTVKASQLQKNTEKIEQAKNKHDQFNIFDGLMG